MSEWVDRGDNWKRILKALELSAQAKAGLELTYPQAMLLQHWIELAGKQIDKGDTLRAEVARLTTEVKRLRFALDWISERKGAYSHDPLTFAENVIEAMAQKAIDTLKGGEK
jgi:hypothetical protein